MNNSDWADYQQHQQDAYYAEQDIQRQSEEDKESDRKQPASASRKSQKKSADITWATLIALMFWILVVASLFLVFGPWVGSSPTERPTFNYSPATILVLTAALHFALIISRRNRLTMWLSIPLLFFYVPAQIGVLDGLRGGPDRAHLLGLSIGEALSMGLWLFACFVYRHHISQAGIEQARQTREALLQSANEALLADANEGKEGEQRVHDTLDIALHRQFGADVAIIPRGGLLPIDGPVPFTDIDHIVITPRCVIVVETKDWKWQRIAAVPGDDTLVERRRPGQIERCKNPYIQASRKPGHLRRTIGLEPNVPIEFVVCFADANTKLDSRLADRMTTIRTLPEWLMGAIHRHQEKLNVAVIAAQIAERLDYDPASYERFRCALNSGEANRDLVKQREIARAEMMETHSAPPSLSSLRPGALPLAMFTVSVGFLGLALLITQTGSVGDSLAKAIEPVAKSVLRWLPPFVPTATASDASTSPGALSPASLAKASSGSTHRQ